jgi:hypothetical protein
MSHTLPLRLNLLFKLLIAQVRGRIHYLAAERFMLSFAVCISPYQIW